MREPKGSIPFEDRNGPGYRLAALSREEVGAPPSDWNYLAPDRIGLSVLQQLLVSWSANDATHGERSATQRESEMTRILQEVKSELHQQRLLCKTLERRLSTLEHLLASSPRVETGGKPNKAPTDSLPAAQPVTLRSGLKVPLSPRLADPSRATLYRKTVRVIADDESGDGDDLE